MKVFLHASGIIGTSELEGDITVKGSLGLHVFSTEPGFPGTTKD